MHFKCEDLQIYQKALDFVDTVYVVIQDFAKHEMYNHSSQFRRLNYITKEQEKSLERN